MVMAFDSYLSYLTSLTLPGTKIPSLIRFLLDWRVHYGKMKNPLNIHYSFTEKTYSYFWYRGMTFTRTLNARGISALLTWSITVYKVIQVPVIKYQLNSIWGYHGALSLQTSGVLFKSKWLVMSHYASHCRYGQRCKSSPNLNHIKVSPNPNNL